MQLQTILIYFATLSLALNSTITNPLLPGWHSDPSCILHSTSSLFLCVTSSFIATPGIPIYASADLRNFRLASHALSRPSQEPTFNTTTDQNGGIYAVTLRQHDGVVYAITTSLTNIVWGLVLRTTDPFSDEAWSEPLLFETGDAIDPDLFWDEDGTVYLTSAGIVQRTIDMSTGAVGPSYSIWNGTGGKYPEGPHIYYKDSFYYLLIAEGGTETGHAVTMARSKSVDGPYDAFKGNPVLTARGTDNYFQTVGHADLFQDRKGNWWAVALSTRSGPEWINYPMGRETVLTAVTWGEGEWPVFTPVEGKESVWKLPEENFDVPGNGAWVGDDDIVDFKRGGKIPRHFLNWRWADKKVYTVSPKGHEGTLQLTPSKQFSNGNYTGPITLLTRTQEHTLFSYSADFTYTPLVAGEEAGVTVFLTQTQHMQLSITIPGNCTTPHLRLRTTGGGTFEGLTPPAVVKAIPQSWASAPIRLQIRAANDTHYTFSATSSGRTEELGQMSEKVIEFGALSATIVSGGSGRFTGTLLGVFATANGGQGTADAYVGRWRYTGEGQKIDHDVVTPA